MKIFSNKFSLWKKKAKVVTVLFLYSSSIFTKPVRSKRRRHCTVHDTESKLFWKQKQYSFHTQKKIKTALQIFDLIENTLLSIRKTGMGRLDYYIV